MKRWQQTSNQVFVLRITRSAISENGRFAWRYVLEDPFSKARRGFASLAELTLYLELLQRNENDEETANDMRNQT